MPYQALTGMLRSMYQRDSFIKINPPIIRAGCLTRPAIPVSSIFFEHIGHINQHNLTDIRRIFTSRASGAKLPNKSPVCCPGCVRASVFSALLSLQTSQITTERTTPCNDAPYAL